MKKPRIVIPDWLRGGVLTAAILLLFLFPFGPLKAMEAKLYDLRARLRQPAGVAQNIAIVEMDDASVAQLGRYPWPRSRMAEGLDVISEGGAKRWYRIMERGMEKDVEKRYQRGNEMAEELRQVIPLLRNEGSARGRN